MPWLNISIDIGILALMGLLYYFYQRKKILKVSKEMILTDLEQFRIVLNEYAEQQKESDKYHSINKFCEKYDLYYQEASLNDFLTIQDESRCLSKNLKQDFSDLCIQITEHITAR